MDHRPDSVQLFLWSNMFRYTGLEISPEFSNILKDNQRDTGEWVVNGCLFSRFLQEGSPGQTWEHQCSRVSSRTISALDGKPTQLLLLKKKKQGPVSSIREEASPSHLLVGNEPRGPCKTDFTNRVRLCPSDCSAGSSKTKPSSSEWLAVTGPDLTHLTWEPKPSTLPWTLAPSVLSSWLHFSSCVLSQHFPTHLLRLIWILF